MKNAILRATLLGIVASASFSLTQVASLAATSPGQMTSSTVCAVNPAQEVAPAAPLAHALERPEETDRFMLLGGN